MVSRSRHLASVANMTAPIPEEQDQPPTPQATPPGEHSSELPDGATPGPHEAEQEENAATALDQPSDDAGSQ